MTDPFKDPPAIRQIYAEMIDLRQQATAAIEHMMGQINRLNTITFALLQEFDLADEITCPVCDDEALILRPKLKNLPTDGNTCPVCGHDFDDADEQTSIDDFGSYVAEDSEE